MNITDSDLRAMVEDLTGRIPDLVQQVATCARAADRHERPSTAQILIKLAKDADDSMKIVAVVQMKTKKAASELRDVTEWTEPETLATFDRMETEGQERIKFGGAE